MYYRHGPFACALDRRQGKFFNDPVEGALFPPVQNILRLRRAKCTTEGRAAFAAIERPRRALRGLDF